jgi:hypothetical protein
LHHLQKDPWAGRTPAPFRYSHSISGFLEELPMNDAGHVRHRVDAVLP